MHMGVVIRMMLCVVIAGCYGKITAGEMPSIVSNIKVLSNKVEDVTTLEDWKRSYINDGMTDHEKAIAIWKTVVKYRHQSSPADEFLYSLNNVHDPMKIIHVYGHNMCCCASSNIEGLARYIGLQARGRIINSHSVCEVFYDNAWHLFDASLMNYFMKPDGQVASVDEIRKEVRDWFDKNPEMAGMRGNDAKLRAFARGEGWKKGPALLASSTFYDKNGINGAGWHGWPSNMQEYDWPDEKATVFDYGPSMGYQLNLQLREGEKITRNWFNKGLIVPGNPKESFHKGDRTHLSVQTNLGDIAPGRIGNGTIEYNVPLASGGFSGGALSANNLACRADDNSSPALHIKDAQNPGILIIGLPCSYVYHTGEAKFDAVVDGADSSISISISQNNGMDWIPVTTVKSSGPQTIDFKPFCYRRYDYRIKFELKGKGTGLETLKFHHDFQHAQTPLPALTEGSNTISFSVGAQEGTVTMEASMSPDNAAKHGVLSHMDFHPKLNDVSPINLQVGATGIGEATYTLGSPGDIARVRMNLHYRARGEKDSIGIEMSFDGGKTFNKVDTLCQAQPASSRYLTYSGVPAGSREVIIKETFKQQNVVCVFDQRVDVDYKQPHGGFRPVKITYIWEENGTVKQDVHIAKEQKESYTILCGPKPLMKSIVLELAD
jgi:hypothetical protein